MEPATHIIGRQRIKLRYHGATDTLALRQMISNVCSDELPARLNRLLDRYDDKDYVLRIDRLDVRVSINDSDNLQETLAKAIIEQVDAALRQKLEQKIMDAVSIDQSFARTLQFYLENGYLPWWSLVKDGPAFQHALQQSWMDEGSFQHIVREIIPLLQATDVRSRLAGLLNDAQFEALVSAAAIWSPQEWRAWQESFELVRIQIAQQAGGLAFDRLVRLAVLEAIGTATATQSVMTAFFAGILKQHSISLTPEMIASLPSPAIRRALIAGPKVPEAARQEKMQTLTIQSPEEGESIHVGNAGLVLVAIYLPALFKNVGLLEDDRLQDVYRAVRLLRYLVFEDAAFEEFDVVLEKILCGMPLAGSIDAGCTITAAEKEQAEALLQSVIEHWTVLKNTTPAGLRHSFLQREGIVSFRNNQWELTVQKQAHDILLDYLPWNISIIKLPWIQHLVVVKWNS